MSQQTLGLIGIFIGVPLIIIDIWLIHMVSVYTEKAESYLQKSTFTEANVSTWPHAGLIGKAMRNGYLTLVLAIPEICSKKGILDITEAREFPCRLKLILFISWGLCFIVTAALLLAGGYIQYLK